MVQISTESILVEISIILPQQGPKTANNCLRSENIENIWGVAAGNWCSLRGDSEGGPHGTAASLAIIEFDVQFRFIHL